MVFHREGKWEKGSIKDFVQPEGGRGLSRYEEFFGFKKEELQGKKVLDLGAGPEAKFEKELKEAGINAEVVSLSPDFSIEEYRSKAISLTPKAHYIAGLGQNLPFREKSFDRIFMFHVGEHISADDLNEMIPEMIRVLKKGGRIYIGPLVMVDYRNFFENDTAKKIFEREGVNTMLDVLSPEIMAPKKIYDDILGVRIGKTPSIRVLME